MHYQIGGPEHFTDAPARARVKLVHDDGRMFFATDRTLGSDFWYIDGARITKSKTGMGGAMYHRTRVVARRSEKPPAPNLCTDPSLQAKKSGQTPSLAAEMLRAKEVSALHETRRKYQASKGTCDRHGIEYHKCYGCKKCRAEMRANGVEQSATPLPKDHVWGERKLPEATTACKQHPEILFVKDSGQCWKCMRLAAIGPVPNKPATPNLPEEDAPVLKQVGGSHYDSMPVDVIEFCERNNLGFTESTAIKYIARRKGESRVEDLRKAINCIERLIKHEETGSWGR